MQIPTLPFNAFGTMALARSEFETNSGSSQVFWLLKVRFLTLELLYNAMQAMVALQCKQCAKGNLRISDLHIPCQLLQQPHVMCIVQALAAVELPCHGL